MVAKRKIRLAAFLAVMGPGVIAGLVPGAFTNIYVAQKEKARLDFPKFQLLHGM